MTKTKFKMCGLHSLEDVETAMGSRADYLGFVFAESKRKVTASQVKSWIETAEKGNKELVALFVNPSIEEIEAVLDEVPIDIIQLHGTESGSFLKTVQQRTGCLVWKALHHGEETISQLKEYKEADGIVIDTRVKGAWGGTGTSFDWEAVPFYKQAGCEYNLPLFIAGGINKDNIADLLSFSPYGVDISSGTERAGKKDPAIIQEIEKRLETHERNVSRS
ncbi:phosphoribosylanthranilate isomerase [Thalassorhabdus alkalitolerans]|uniref:N-(5'-phosphoribosyl)anthranilate isomerase n=1 Tax=Thalassorhabdus alkalitolerans TaxID=2282697 RepID=A0ABW0YNZ6_9BACI